MDERKKGGWSLFTDYVEWWQNYLTEISVLVVGLGLTYWGEHAVHRSAQGGREPPLPQAGVSGFRLSGGTEQGCMKKSSSPSRRTAFFVSLAGLSGLAFQYFFDEGFFFFNQVFRAHGYEAFIFSVGI